MEKVIQQFVENGVSNGLMLLDMPTGSGKTHSVLHYIYKSIIEQGSTKKYFFITTLKKNLPKEALRCFFRESGHEAVFDEKFLFIDSNVESVKNGLTPETERIIPDRIKSWDEYSKLKEHIDILRSSAKHGFNIVMRSYLEEQLRNDIERRFRYKLEELLKKSFPTVALRLHAIHTNKDWQWVARLYPAVFTGEKQIIFMSMDKLLSQNSTLVEPSYMFLSSNIIKEAVIFIDEFDATKETVLNHIIRNSKNKNIDLIQLFNDIHSGLSTHDFRDLLTQPSKQRKGSAHRNQSLQPIIDKLKEMADNIYRTHHLNYSHKTINVQADVDKHFLFHDYKYHLLINGKQKYITTKCDEQQKVNYIEYCSKRPERSEDHLHFLLGQITGFVLYFCGAIEILAFNYKQRHAENYNDDGFTILNALNSILSEFNLSQTNTTYLIEQILLPAYKSRGSHQNVSYDLSFYEGGFRYFMLEDSHEHDMHSNIMMSAYQNTPEKICLHICEKAKVIGISATASIPTVLGNYDIDYLRSRLGKSFYEVSAYDKERLRKQFVESQNGYQGINIHTKLLGCEKYNKEVWMDVLEDSDYAEFIYERLERDIGGQNDYNQQRILRVAMAFKEFLLHDDIQSFLCILTKHPRKGDATLDLDILLDLFKHIACKCMPAFCVDRQVVQLDGDEYEEKKDSITDQLKKGEKLFVISVYQTIGAGQNLQYAIPAGMQDKLVCLNHERSSTEKDFDAIYLDRPTNITVNLANGIQEAELAKYIFQIEFLLEKSEISMNDALIAIKAAFACYSAGEGQRKQTKLSDKRSVILMATKLVIQAIGRICRTNMKSKNIYVYADRNICDCLDLTVLDGRVLNYEFHQLMNAAGKSSTANDDSSALIAANLVSVRASKYIQDMIHARWTNTSIEDWKRLREFVLKYPTVEEAQFVGEESSIVSSFYVHMPAKANELFYNQKDDYNNIEVCFERNSKYPMTVSENAARLTEFMKIECIRSYFESKGYATMFEPNEYIMSPAVFNNIYKGALGEVVGRELFYKFTNETVVLDEIRNTDLFELFDFQVHGRDIYIDFKNWHETFLYDDIQMVEKIRKKAALCGCRCVIVVNILSDSKYKIRKRKIDQFELVEIPTLMDASGTAYCIDAVKEIRRCLSEYTNQNQ